jgi:GT2 family glycosyltransferase
MNEEADRASLFSPITVREIPKIRPCVKGKFLFIGEEKFYVRGVTYGTFRSDSRDNEFHTSQTVDDDFAAMSANGINAVRSYTVPPWWMLDLALKHGLYVMVGLPWEQHIAFLDDRERASAIKESVRAGVRACAGHPAVLCYAVGNEIPASIVRWHGRKRIERFLKRLYHAAKQEDPEGLVTYVNFPTTEYLQLPFVDFLCFNVYLETQEKLEGYLARLQNIAGERPLVIAEIGLDSRRNGEQKQAHVLEWQARTAFAGGCVGVFVFSWTDEWYRGGFDIEDWDFGLTTRHRHPKPALVALRPAFDEAPFAPDLEWPPVSVVVCTFNGQRTIAECLDKLGKLDYPNYEVIVIDDGSTDATPFITCQYPVRVITTENRGLSAARNAGCEAATGEIVAYIDDDAYPDPHWLKYLAYMFVHSSHAGVGGPNIPPRGDGVIAECIANAPGGPVHVLISDCEAEHLPGCNMAFRKSALEEIGGFDPQFHTAGDDVDICWRLQRRGWTLGFSPAAMVLHHRRNSVRAYWKQQRDYGKAEALLERKWSERYNSYGHVAWTGRLYGRGITLSPRRVRVYHGTWGSSLFQSLYDSGPGTLASLLVMPEWLFMNLALALLGAAGTFWRPLFWFLPCLLFSAGAPFFHIVKTVARISFSNPPKSRFHFFARRTLTAFLHILQPLARLSGRLQHGLTPWRRTDVRHLTLPGSTVWKFWSESWRTPEAWLISIEAGLQGRHTSVVRGGNFDAWDLLTRGGLLGAVRIHMAIEEHPSGKQLLLFRLWFACSHAGLILIALFGTGATVATLKQAWLAGTLLAASAGLLGGATVLECLVAKLRLNRTLRGLHQSIAAPQVKVHAAAEEG